ncbi:hypothetical protein IW140_006506 [Coemansia sp. RSA 1813]|nr:hypothetical protein EV178_002932 [Coemansia sp. RSA 1646]KAJ1765126.1 hypothetical protein LPJ74_006474 [Coemansia sp. RSA 1843]KAJ2089641.1 hypothetical protein IW138_003239 [Coemansia sp. RSA 986]KAJ2210185.1 hypothetical protein EV179_006401 [Coemansia sp. RSA 487]KAJ2561969.1 hypothetical protein IW140_006506 [Coemansia sp. RSA 1813]
MSRRVTNFDQEIFAVTSGFQSIRASTLPGRTLEPEWFGSLWPRHPSPFVTFNTVAGGGSEAVMRANQHHRQHFSAQPSVFNPVFFEAPQIPAEMKDETNQRIIKLTSDVFRIARPRVQVRGNRLIVHAKRAKAIEGANRYVKRDDTFNYELDLPPIFNLPKVKAKRVDNVLTLTIPKK